MTGIDPHLGLCGVGRCWVCGVGLGGGQAMVNFCQDFLISAVSTDASEHLALSLPRTECILQNCPERTRLVLEKSANLAGSTHMD